MRKTIPLIILCITLAITACFHTKSSKKYTIDKSNTNFIKPTNSKIDDRYIVLQHPVDRTVIKCKNYTLKTKEECAKEFETLGYVRLKDKVKSPAKYDDAKSSTYPSRRWRDGENTPRW